MSNGKITIKKLNLLGYTPETQVFFIQNGGGAGVFEFLQSNRKHFDQSLFMGQVYNALVAPRIAKFKAYAESKGFEVIAEGWVG